MGMNAKVTQVGLDCHKNFSKVTAREELGRVVWRQRLEHGDRQRLREQLRSWPPGLPVVLEGTFGWGWMSDELSAAGHHPHLANSRKVAGWRDARGIAKSNRIDADLLSELWSEKPTRKGDTVQRWWEVWLAPAEVRDQREWLRYRMTLVRTQTQIKNRVHATLHRHGILHEHSDLFGKAGLQFLEQLKSDPARLRDSARCTLAGYLALLKQVRQQIAVVTRQLKRQLRGSAVGMLWRSLPGINWVLGYTICAEIGCLERFAGSRKLAAYALLAPIADDSGDEDDARPIGRHVGKIGRVTLKWAFIEAARGAIRKSDYFRAIYDRRTDGGQRDKGRGQIAVAHELLRVGYSCVKNDRSFSEQRPPPRAKTRQEQSSDLLVRECVGPDRPLAAVLA